VGIGIYIDPPAPALLNDRFFTESISSLARCLGIVKSTFEAQGILVHTVDRLPSSMGSDTYLYVSIGNHNNYSKVIGRQDVILSAFMVTESPIVSPSIFTGLKRAKHHFKRVFSCIDQTEMPRLVGAQIDCIPLRWPMDFNTVDELLWSRSHRKFLTMINMNKLTRLGEGELYTERMRAVEFFSRTDEIDLYGVGWDKATMRVGYRWLPWTIRKRQIAFREWLDKVRPDPLLVAARKVYKGELPEKWETLSHYDFALCFENIKIKGWLTEKLFECLRVGTIPIYWGATDICELVPSNCFIDMRQFSNYTELGRFMKGLSSAAVKRYRDAGRAFLESKAFDPFSKERFADIFEAILNEDAGIRMAV
jgi:hypothetical protein